MLFSFFFSSENEILEHDSSFDVFYMSFAALAANNISGQCNARKYRIQYSNRLDIISTAEKSVKIKQSKRVIWIASATNSLGSTPSTMHNSVSHSMIFFAVALFCVAHFVMRR